MRTLGLDLSLTATGIALVGDAPLPEQPYRAAVPPRGLRGAVRLSWLGRAVMDEVERMQPDLVAIEGYSFGARGNAVFQLGELGGVIRFLLFERGMLTVEVAPGEWRKQLFGRGNLPKDQVRVEAWKRYAVEFDSLDVLEAWCVATAAHRRTQGLDKPLPKRRSRAAA
jgi:Holliday junction resolvasome RuvABC endonuclease subunit